MESKYVDFTTHEADEGRPPVLRPPKERLSCIGASVRLRTLTTRALHPQKLVRDRNPDDQTVRSIRGSASQYNPLTSSLRHVQATEKAASEENWRHGSSPSGDDEDVSGSTGNAGRYFPLRPPISSLANNFESKMANGLCATT